jgi:hypothetical protein
LEEEPDDTVAPLQIVMNYPADGVEVEAGQSLRLTAQLFDAASEPVTDAALQFRVMDAGGDEVAIVQATPGNGGVYRSDAWVVPFGNQSGEWKLIATAQRNGSAGSGETTMTVLPSPAELIRDKYGFWIDLPTLGGIAPTLAAERGDAQAGMIRWGGVRSSVHILPQAWVEVHWRSSQADLTTVGAVRDFMLGTLGDFGFVPTRELGPMEPYTFKEWEGWHVGAQGQTVQDLVDWIVFYAPEVDKTFAIGTTVVEPPVENPHDVLRDSFVVYPEIAAAGVAPEPLRQLLPGPELRSPALGERVVGLEDPIVLSWAPLRELAPDEYYDVRVDYNYAETNTSLHLTTRDTQVTLPEELYHTPNCRVFNWQVTLRRQTAVGDTGQPVGEPLSYASLYRYVEWLYPPDVPEPFPLWCPNAQF